MAADDTPTLDPQGKPAIKSLGVLGPFGGLAVAAVLEGIDQYSGSTGISSGDVQQLAGCVMQNPKWLALGATALGCAVGLWGRLTAKHQITGVISSKGASDAAKP